MYAMQIDKTTLQDLSIYNREENESVFNFLNHTQTVGGRDYLYWMLGKPLDTIELIQDNQQTIQQLIAKQQQLPTTITNGTIMVLQKFFDTPIDSYPKQPDYISSVLYKLLHEPDFAITRYTIEHLITFVKGLKEITTIFNSTKNSKEIQTWIKTIELYLQKPTIELMLQVNKGSSLSNVQVLEFGEFLHSKFKQNLFVLIDVYSKIDAFSSLAICCTKYQFCFPEIVNSKQPFIKVEGLYHLLLSTPTSYTLTLNKSSNFLFLTGANMAGKSTFIKAVGICVYLAHIGMGVPATTMQISKFDGMLSNINLVDNLMKGESYFFNEVQRIKKTVETIADGKNWLILIDELFKGTNVQDAMKCSTTVIEGLRKMDNALFVFSTHLYEIGEDLKKYSNINFKYFETNIINDQLEFSYQLKDGISNDRLGYLILQREGVVKLLSDL